MAQMNLEHSDNRYRTIIIPAQKEFAHIRSSFLRDMIVNGGDISKYVPANIAEHYMQSNGKGTGSERISYTL